MSMSFFKQALGFGMKESYDSRIVNAAVGGLFSIAAAPLKAGWAVKNALIGKMSWDRAKNIGAAGVGLGANIGTAGLYGLGVAARAGGWALNNPNKALAIGAAGLGFAGLASSDYGQSNASDEGLAMIAQSRYSENGRAVGSSTAAAGMNVPSSFENSTHGLVQGMHRNRH